MSFAELKSRQSVAWGSGPYEPILQSIADVHALVVDRIAPERGADWLDAACGTGGVAFVAAERGARVVGLDFAPALVETARRLAAERGLDVRFDVGDAEAMPYADASFDVVSSTFGVMFAPDHPAVAAELARVTRPGGRIALASWPPNGLIAEQFDVLWRFAPPPPPPAGNPFAWGAEDAVRELLGDGFELDFEQHVTPLRLASGEEHWELFASSFGPTKTAADALPDDRREEFHRSWVAWAETKREGDEIVHRREYLLTLGTRR